MSEVAGAALGVYEESFLGKLRYPGPFDGRGVPLYRYGPPFGNRYVPVLVAQYALGLHERLVAGAAGQDRERFLAQVVWLAEHARDRAGAAVWHHDVPLPKWSAQAPWISAMAQGQAISVLLRGHELTGEGSLLDTALRAFRSFERSIQEGGVASAVNGGRFYEEVAVEPAAHILNGMVYALWGIRDLARLVPDERIARAFDEGVAGLAGLLPRFDAGYWSRYSLLYPNQIASRAYHEIHARQLARLHEITKDAVVGDHARRFRAYAASARCRARQALAYPYYRARYQLERFRTYLELS